MAVFKADDIPESLFQHQGGVVLQSFIPMARTLWSCAFLGCGRGIMGGLQCEGFDFIPQGEAMPESVLFLLVVFGTCSRAV